jgi:hypothetical protein
MVASEESLVDEATSDPISRGCHVPARRNVAADDGAPVSLRGLPVGGGLMEPRFKGRLGL